MDWGPEDGEKGRGQRMGRKGGGGGEQRIGREDRSGREAREEMTGRRKDKGCGQRVEGVKRWGERERTNPYICIR